MAKFSIAGCLFFLLLVLFLFPSFKKNIVAMTKEPNKKYIFIPFHSFSWKYMASVLSAMGTALCNTPRSCHEANLLTPTVKYTSCHLCSVNELNVTKLNCNTKCHAMPPQNADTSKNLSLQVSNFNQHKLSKNPTAAQTVCSFFLQLNQGTHTLASLSPSISEWKLTQSSPE